MNNTELKAKLESKQMLPVSDTITLNYISMLARSTDDDLFLASEVRRMLDVPKSRKPKITLDNNIMYMPCEKKL